MTNFRKNMISQRREKGWSQADLAERLSQSGLQFYPQTVQKIESGERRVQLSEAVEISAALEFEIDLMLADPAENYLDELELNVADAIMKAVRAIVEVMTEQQAVAKHLDFMVENDAVDQERVDRLDENLRGGIGGLLNEARRMFKYREDEQADMWKRVLAELPEDERKEAMTATGPRERLRAVRVAQGLPAEREGKTDGVDQEAE